MPIDFGFGGAASEVQENGAGGEQTTDLNNGGVKPTSPEDKTDLNNLDDPDNKDKDGKGGGNDGNGDGGNGDNDNGDENAIELTPGTTFEFDGNEYTVAENGDILDKDGKVFKEAKDVSDWTKTLNVSENEENTDITLENIQKQLGIQVTDEEDKPIEYENTLEGISSYVKDAIETAKQEHYQTAIDTLFNKYPVIEQVLNYYLANGNSLEGFNEMPDRSNIELDENNEEQQELIIKTAWKEQGRKGDVNGYIAYLKSSGTLKDVAAEELEGLKEADKAYKDRIAAEAAKAQKEEQEAKQQYWQGVHEVIKSKKIAGYQIPDNIIITRDNKKISATPEDFFKYIFNVDKDGNSAYMLDLAKETPESRRDDEILRAYLKFTGGNYSNLVSMAIAEEKVKQLRLSSKNTRTVKITSKPNNKKEDKLDLGY